ncbi:unannotated protein [freshwater metagenome]|uniref:Unannotated protein n=1 Tax=freshwater metagenome TaxID=449393 RepID=A0A6J7IXS1_9ZZZZ
MHQSDCLGDGLRAQQHRFDLGKLDTQTTQLHLEVGTADVLEFAVGAPTNQVAGAVETFTRLAERIGDEAIGGEIAAADIAASELNSGQVQLAGSTDRGRSKRRVEHVQTGVPDRRTDGNGHAVVAGDVVVADVDGGLGRTVEVVQLGLGELRELRGGGGRKCFATAEDEP